MSIVVIWENNMLPGGRARHTNGHDWCGHAALLIGDNWGPFAGATGDNYVSWWPQGEAGPLDTRPAATNPHLVNDINAERYLPDHFIQLPDRAVDVLEMRATWNAIRAPGGQYRMVRNNCSTIVARVMRSGGYTAGGLLSAMWYDHSCVWTPNKVRKFALRAGGTTMLWSTVRTALTNLGIPAEQYGANRQVRDGQFCTSVATRGDAAAATAIRFNSGRAYAGR